MNDPHRVHLLRLEALHDFEEFVVDAGTVAEFQFDLV